ncbi:MAG: hypothetical protein J3K34DRAFT_402165 [Monoraphidium minutum]|nr:MAG: hypothetical protein J3K34DRAFT_402165 [Monoraphidium minutum]
MHAIGIQASSSGAALLGWGWLGAAAAVGGLTCCSAAGKAATAALPSDAAADQSPRAGAGCEPSAGAVQGWAEQPARAGVRGVGAARAGLGVWDFLASASERRGRAQRWAAPRRAARAAPSRLCLCGVHGRPPGGGAERAHECVDRAHRSSRAWGVCGAPARGRARAAVRAAPIWPAARTAAPGRASKGALQSGSRAAWGLTQVQRVASRELTAGSEGRLPRLLSRARQPPLLPAAPARRESGRTLLPGGRGEWFVSVLGGGAGAASSVVWTSGSSGVDRGVACGPEKRQIAGGKSGRSHAVIRHRAGVGAERKCGSRRPAAAGGAAAIGGLGWAARLWQLPRE